ncbi:uncharacterized protein BYT42DRAFT_583749 [Radiomyces spectabilis]|uniref:uncharacterized protein n=1 Tax=Radiomyces spectabilis TaxID=64574 RepID=UPI00221FDF37|nr:uncharacterized protein BYT42DRAFT_583749 [Radiomyces spectabilis]KAI8369269.1 hypothetical protein BYT42DRAFT_583749 [Radiomyces spectabilis]
MCADNGPEPKDEPVTTAEEIVRLPLYQPQLSPPILENEESILVMQAQLFGFPSGRPKCMKKVSFSSIVTTIPRYDDHDISEKNVLNGASLSTGDTSVQTTRGFWEKFTNEIGKKHTDIEANHRRGDRFVPSSSYPRQDEVVSRNCSEQKEIVRPKNKFLYALKQTLNSKRINTVSPNTTNIHEGHLTPNSPKQMPMAAGREIIPSPPPIAPVLKRKQQQVSGHPLLPPVSQGPILHHPTKHRPKKPASFRKSTFARARTSTTVPLTALPPAAQPAWR